MNIRFSKQTIVNISLLLPLITIFFAEFLIFINPPLGTLLKLFSVFYMLFYFVVKGKYDINVVLLLPLIILLLIYHFFISFNYTAASKELIRYLFPISVFLFSIVLSDKIELLFRFFLKFLIFNWIVQIGIYICYFNDINLWFYTYHPNGFITIPKVSGIIRATGVLGFFGYFGFLNLIMFFFISHFYKGKKKKLLKILCIVFMLCSLSYKTIGTFLLLQFIFSKYKFNFIFYILILTILFFLFFPDLSLSLYKTLFLKIELYISGGESARSESYRVMFNNISLLGEGLGSFGGPASLEYKSPVYEKVDFNWYGLKNYLKTTDTYYPHLFIELGWLGSFSYLFFLMLPLLNKNKRILKILFIVYFSLFFDAIFSYSLNNLAYLITSILFVYPFTKSQENNYA